MRALRVQERLREIPGTAPAAHVADIRHNELHRQPVVGDFTQAMPGPTLEQLAILIPLGDGQESAQMPTHLKTGWRPAGKRFRKLPLRLDGRGDDIGNRRMVDSAAVDVDRVCKFQAALRGKCDEVFPGILARVRRGFGESEFHRLGEHLDGRQAVRPPGLRPESRTLARLEGGKECGGGLGTPRIRR